MQQRAARRATRFSGRYKRPSRLPTTIKHVDAQAAVTKQYPGDIWVYDSLPDEIRWMIRFNPFPVAATAVAKAWENFSGDVDEFIDRSRTLFERHRDVHLAKDYGPDHPQIGEIIMEF